MGEPIDPMQTENSLVTLIAHLVYSGLDIETALERGREYTIGSWGYGLIVSPTMAEYLLSEAMAKANQSVLEATPKAWQLVEQWRKEGKEVQWKDTIFGQIALKSVGNC